MKKNPSWAKLSHCQQSWGKSTHSAHSFLGEKVFEHETSEEGAVSAVWVLRTNPQFTLSKRILLWSGCLLLSLKDLLYLSAASR